MKCIDRQTVHKQYRSNVRIIAKLILSKKKMHMPVTGSNFSAYKLEHENLYHDSAHSVSQNFGGRENYCHVMLNLGA